MEPDLVLTEFGDNGPIKAIDFRSTSGCRIYNSNMETKHESERMNITHWEIKYYC